VLSFICTPSKAASFDCAAAQTSVEKLICASEELSALDSQLGAAYRALLNSVSTQDQRPMVREQQIWLRNVRNKCSDATCLQESYAKRLDELDPDPFADMRLTCEEMRKHQVQIFSSDSIDLGSGSGSPLEVDYACPESLSQQPFMRNLLDLAERIRSEDAPSPCTGTIVSAHGRYYQFSLTRAGLAPRELRSFGGANRPGMDWESFGTSEALSEDEAVFLYFKQWSEESTFNKRLYSEFRSEYERVVPQLVQFHERLNGLSQSEALVAAKNGMKIVLDRAAGSSPSSEFRKDSLLVSLVRNDSIGIDDLKNAVNLSSKEDLYDALAVALLNKRPLEVISVLAGLTTTDYERLSEGKEPLLSLATADPQSLELLIASGVPVDSENGFGKTALFYAIGERKHEVVKLLLSHAADVNHEYKSESVLRPDTYSCNYPNLKHTRRTPLMHAAQNSDVSMLMMLIQAGAKKDSVDDLGFNALDYAKMGGAVENVNYLLSLGLEYGAPIYSSAPDPAIREQRLIATVPIDGNVNRILAAPDRPDILVASVFPSSAAGQTRDQGLYLFSISDPAYPKMLSIIPQVFANDFALSKDGKVVYLIQMENAQLGTGRDYGLNIFDISNPESPRLSQVIPGNFQKMHLSLDGKTLYLQERSIESSSSRGLVVVNVSAVKPSISCENPFGDDPRQQIFYSYATFPDEPLLLVDRSFGRLALYDVHDPCMPTLLSEIRNEEFNSRMVGGAGRTITTEGEGIKKFRWTDSLVRIARYEGSAYWFQENLKSGMAATVMAPRDVVVFRIGSRGQFILSDRFQLDVDYPGGLFLADDGHVYIGWKGGLGVGMVPLQ